MKQASSLLSILSGLGYLALWSCQAQAQVPPLITPPSRPPAQNLEEEPEPEAEIPSPVVANIDLTARLNELRVTEGPFAGTFRVMKDDDRLNWYFCNLALYPLVNLENYGLIRTYLNQYLNHVNPKTGTIQDFKFSTSQPVTSDSDDAYAATFLSLAVRYREITNNRVWWERNVTAMKSMARKVLLVAHKESGLVRVRAVKAEGNQAYLMDNCEVYRGLKDLSRILEEDNDPDAAQFKKAADKVAKGINSLFDEETQAFRVSDSKWDSTFYPARVAQIFPELYGVPLGTNSETQRKYDAAWKFLNANADAWETGTLTDPADKSLGGFPWMLLGYSANKRNDQTRVKKHLDYFLQQHAQTPIPAPFTAVHELGFALRIQGAPAQVLKRR